MIFSGKNISVKRAAEILGKDEAFIRCGIRAGTLPIGVATKKNERYSYYISPKLLYELTGYCDAAE